MSRPARELRGVRRRTAPTVEVRATIFEAEPCIGAPSFACLIYCPEIFSAPKRIFGADEYQAVELSETFVRSMFEHHEIDFIETKRL